MKPRSGLLWFVAAFVVVGAFLPTFLPGRSFDERPPASTLRSVCEILYWLQERLPRGTPDSIRIPVGLVSLALWGTACGLLYLGVSRMTGSRRVTTNGE